MKRFWEKQSKIIRYVYINSYIKHNIVVNSNDLSESTLRSRKTYISKYNKKWCVKVRNTYTYKYNTYKRKGRSEYFKFIEIAGMTPSSLFQFEIIIIIRILYFKRQGIP